MEACGNEEPPQWHAHMRTTSRVSPSQVDAKLLRDTRKKLPVQSRVRPQTPDQRENTGKMGTGPRKTEPAGAALVLLVRKYPDTLPGRCTPAR